MPDVVSSVWKQTGSLLGQILTTARKPQLVMDRVRTTKVRTTSKGRFFKRSPLRLGTASSNSSTSSLPLAMNRIDTIRSEDEEKSSEDSASVKTPQKGSRRSVTMPFRLRKSSMSPTPSNDKRMTYTEEPLSLDRNNFVKGGYDLTGINTNSESVDVREASDSILNSLSSTPASTASSLNNGKKSSSPFESHTSKTSSLYSANSEMSPTPSSSNLSKNEKMRLILGRSADHK